jgi:ArsR family transcriptional regulator
MEKVYKHYALLMKALSDETRVKIFHMLSHGELCACNILDEFNITQPTLSYHMKILSDSGLVNSRRDGIWMKYTINKDNLEILNKLFNDIAANDLVSTL